MQNLDRDELQQELITEGKTRIYHYWKQEIDQKNWRIWNTLTPQIRAQPATIVKEVEEELGRRKNYSHGRKLPAKMGTKRWQGIQSQRSLTLYHGPGPGRPDTTMG
jgi:hypothetical protein